MLQYHLFRIHISFFLKASQHHNIDHKSVHKILRLKFYPYKVKLVQELNDDPNYRLEFCDLMMKKIDADRNFLFNIVFFFVFFFDETTFKLNDQVNRHNYWSDNNPHLILESHIHKN